MYETTPWSCLLAIKTQQKNKIKGGTKQTENLVCTTTMKAPGRAAAAWTVMQHYPRNKIMHSSVHQVEL
jgi:hypothetical protein